MIKTYRSERSESENNALVDGHGNCKASMEALDTAIAIGLADSEAGRVKPAGEVFDRLERKYQAMIDAAYGVPPT